LCGDTSSAHVTRHFLAFEDAPWRLALTNGPWGAVRDRVTVGVVLAAKVPSLDRSRVALTLGSTLNVNDLTGFELLNREFAA
jgi:hypothetical protein